MPTPDVPIELHADELLRRNVHIDRDLIAALEQCSRALELLGAAGKSEYRLALPLDGQPVEMQHRRAMSSDQSVSRALPSV